MKPGLKISLLLNVGLLGGLVFLWANQQREEPAAALPARTTVGPPPQTAVVSATPIVRQAEAHPFHWSQLESADYPAYIKNLRNIGCPEMALRAIVTADIHKRYEIRFQQLDEKLTALANSSWSAQLAGFDSEQEIKAELQHLPDEEATEIAGLLGEKPVQSTVADSTASTASLRARQPQESPVSLPLALQNIDPAALTVLNLNDDQKQSVADVQQKLLMQNKNPAALNPNGGQKQTAADASQSSQQAGGTTQNPQDPASSLAPSQQEAQMEADAALQASLGYDGYLGYKLAQERTALENQWKLHPSWVLVEPHW